MRSKQSVSPGQAWLRTASANVTTLGPAEFRRNTKLGIDSTSRIEYLESRFAEWQLDIVFVQEGRIPQQGVSSGTFYIRHAAPGDKDGNYGSQIWFRQTTFKQATLASRVIGPRIILTRVAQGTEHFYALSAHAPTNVAPACDKFDFWKQLRNVIRDLPGRRRVVMGVDANADDKDTAQGANQLFFQELLDELDGTDVALYHGNLAPTWRSSRGSYRRLDRIVTFGKVWHKEGSYQVHSSEYISTVEDADHSMISTVLMVPRDGASERTAKSPHLRFDRLRLADEARISQFQGDISRLADIVAIRGWRSTDEYLEHISAKIYELQQKHFAAPTNRIPRKPWLSEATWQLVQMTPRIRGEHLRAKRSDRRACLKMAFMAWRWPGNADLLHQACQESMAATADWRPRALRARAHAIRVKCMIATERQNWAAALAAEAEVAAEAGDTSTLYSIAKQLRSGAKPKGHASMVRGDGSVIFDPEDVAVDWLEYWAALYRGQVTTVGALKAAPQSNAGFLQSKSPALPYTWIDFPDVSAGRIAEILAHLPGRRAVGPDAIRHDVVKAAGEGCPRMLAPLFMQCLLQQRAPVYLKGGTSFNIHKKGPTCLKDNYRGVVAETAFGKTYAHIIAQPLLPSYGASLVPDTQAGCVKGRGTSLAGAASAGWIYRHNAMRRCWAILFLDLSKAFDTVFRELALGPRDVPPTELATTLRSRGVPPEVADAIVEFLDTKGPRILAGGLEPAAAQAIADWHAATWSHVRPLDGQPPTPVSDSVPVASSTIGARQGDRLGAIVFNIIYDIMLSEVRERLQALGISTTMWVAPDAVPWHTNVNTTEQP